MTSTANVNSTQFGQSLFSNTSSLSSSNVNALPNAFRTGLDAANASQMKGGQIKGGQIKGGAGIPFLQGGNTISRRRLRRISNKYKMRGNKKSIRKHIRRIKSRLQKRTRHNRK
jgi:hypothetical protein